MFINHSTIVALLGFALLAIASNVGYGAEFPPSAPETRYVLQTRRECAYDVTYAHRDTDRKQGALELYIETLAAIDRQLPGEFGEPGRRYWNGGNRYSVTMRPHSNHRNYLRCAHIWQVLSERGVRDWDNKNKVTPEYGYWFWELKRKGTLMDVAGTTLRGSGCHTIPKLSPIRLYAKKSHKTLIASYSSTSAKWVPRKQNRSFRRSIQVAGSIHGEVIIPFSIILAPSCWQIGGPLLAAVVGRVWPSKSI